MRYILTRHNIYVVYIYINLYYTYTPRHTKGDRRFAVQSLLASDFIGVFMKLWVAFATACIGPPHLRMAPVEPLEQWLSEYTMRDTSILRHKRWVVLTCCKIAMAIDETECVYNILILVS